MLVVNGFVYKLNVCSFFGVKVVLYVNKGFRVSDVVIEVFFVG